MLEPVVTGQQDRPERAEPHRTERPEPHRPERPRPLLRTMLGDVLRRTRLDQRRTLADVARAAKVSMPYLSEVERGRKEASSEVLAAICDALRIDLADLLAEAGQQPARRASPTGEGRQAWPRARPLGRAAAAWVRFAAAGARGRHLPARCVRVA